MRHNGHNTCDKTVMASITKGLPQKFNVNKVPGKPKKRKHITLTFDEGKRREFLGGFHKRKLQRQKKAQEELQRQLKEDKKKIKQDARERYKTLLSQRDVPELEELLSRQEYESEGRTVSILELNVADLAQKNNWIGENKVTYEDDDEEEIGEEEPRAMDAIAGMELKERKSKTKAPVEFAESSEAFGSKKEVKHAIKRAALKQVQKSKAFQLKQKLEGQKNRKEMLRKKRKNDKILSKKQKGKSKKKSR